MASRHNGPLGMRQAGAQLVVNSIATVARYKAGWLGGVVLACALAGQAAQPGASASPATATPTGAPAATSTAIPANTNCGMVVDKQGLVIKSSKDSDQAGCGAQFAEMFTETLQASVAKMDGDPRPPPAKKTKPALVALPPVAPEKQAVPAYMQSFERMQDYGKKIQGLPLAEPGGPDPKKPSGAIAGTSTGGARNLPNAATLNESPKPSGWPWKDRFMKLEKLFLGMPEPRVQPTGLPPTASKPAK